MISDRFYQALQRIGWVLFSIYVPLEVEGAEHIPENGAFLLVSNHVSALDPVVIPITCPRRLAFLGKKEIFDNVFGRFIARGFLVIPVDRENPAATTAKRALQVLRSNTPIMITPEGTRSRDGTLQAFKPGFIKLAHRARVPVLPVGIVGAFKVLPPNRKLPRPGRVVVNYGPLYTTFLEEAGDLSDSDIARHAEAIRSMVAALLEMGKGVDGVRG